MATGTPRLSEVARHIVEPDGIVSTGWPAVRATAAVLGLGFDGWQDGAGRLILAKREDGLYAADTSVLSIPRQVGKTYLIGAIVFALCLIYPGLTVLWTAHRSKTADEVFESMEGLARRKLVRPYVRAVFRGSGKQAIRFRNKSRILFGAREQGFGRGFSKVGVLVFDEAQILTENAMDDMVPSTNTTANPLIILVGTPPKPKDPGEIFSQHRQEAIDGESTETLYIELSAERGCDPKDRAQWRRANPSYPSRTSERAMLRMLKNLGLDSFIREGLGIWDEINKNAAVVSARRWRGLAGPGPEDGTRPSAFGVDQSHAGEISIAAAWIAPDGESIHAEEVWAGVDEDAAVRWLAERAPRHVAICVDKASPAMSMVPGLVQRGRKVREGTSIDMIKDCGAWLSKCKIGKFSHAEQQAVTDAVDGGRKRAIGTAGGWGWDRRDETVNIAPIVAVTKATGGALLVRPPSSSGRTTRARASHGRRPRG